MNTLKKDREFQEIYKKQKKAHSKYTIIFYSKKSLNSESKFGFVASKKTGNAVKRNRIKRILREVVRNNEIKFNDKYNYIFVAKTIFKDIDGFKMQEIEKDILNGIRRIK